MIRSKIKRQGAFLSALTASVACGVQGFANDETISANLDPVTLQGESSILILESFSATKSNLNIMETPAPFIAIDKVLFDQQGITTLQDAIRNLSGVSQAGNNYGIGDNIIVRGHAANFTTDGMYAGGGLNNNYNPTRTLTNVESIEVIKGPAAGIYGIGSAGGIVNFVEKKPLDYNYNEVEFAIGAWDHYRGTIDTTGPLSENTGYRVVASIESEDGFRGLSSERNEIYATLSHSISDNHKFSFLASFLDDENQIDSVGDPVRILNFDSLIDPSLGYTWENLVNDFDADGDGERGVQLTDEQRQILADSITSIDGLEPYDLGSGDLISPIAEPDQGEEFRFKVTHDWTFSETTELTHQLQYRTYESNFTRQTGAFNYVYWNRNGEINADPRAPVVDENGVIYPFSARRQEYRHQEAEETSLQYFADLKSEWESDRFNGEHLLSFQYLNLESEVKSWSIWDEDGTAEGGNPVPYIYDIRDPNWPTGSFWDYSPSLRTNYDKSVETWGIGFQEIVQFNENLTARIGYAYNTIDQTYEHKGSDRSPTATPEADTSDSGTTYNLGLNYMINDQFSVFTSIAKGRTAYSILGSIAGSDDRPDSESKSFDVGIRYQAFDDKLLASFTYYETRLTNLRYSNPEYNDNEGDADFNIDVPQYFFDDENNSEGFEFDINIDFTEQFSLNANATYLDAITIRSGFESVQIKGIPQKFGSIWGEYRIKVGQSDVPLAFNFGLSYEDERTVNSTGFGLPDAMLPSYVVFDAGVSYTINDWNLRLNVYNLTDERYYSKAMFLGGQPADARNAKLTVKYEF
ncbi:TonB-dependent receptor [Puniceicoccaceae bacterium K14]|nr:TonB-dependent receptor [Puniceicoccaceae bacterium K14]